MFGSNSKVWVVGLFVALGVLSWALFRNFTEPWIDKIDFNSACWSQSAHNTVRAGLLATKGVPTAFYFGPLPIPPSGYYTHHPPLLSLMLAGMFAVLGEKCLALLDAVDVGVFEFQPPIRFKLCKCCSAS